jgi:hypothetical protein
MRFYRGFVATIVLLASFSAAQATTYQRGKILDIQAKGSPSAVHKATDAPAPPTAATYDIKVQIGDMVYVGRYRHASDFVPSNWIVGQSVDARVGKHKHRTYLKNVSGTESLCLLSPGNPQAAGRQTNDQRFCFIGGDRCLATVFAGNNCR